MKDNLGTAIKRSETTLKPFVESDTAPGETNDVPLNDMIDNIERRIRLAME